MALYSCQKEGPGEHPVPGRSLKTWCGGEGHWEQAVGHRTGSVSISEKDRHADHSTARKNTQGHEHSHWNACLWEEETGVEWKQENRFQRSVIQGPRHRHTMVMSREQRTDTPRAPKIRSQAVDRPPPHPRWHGYSRTQLSIHYRFIGCSGDTREEWRQRNQGARIRHTGAQGKEAGTGREGGPPCPGLGSSWGGGAD